MAATLQKKSFGGIISVIITKKITKTIVSGNYFVIISARMVYECQTPAQHWIKILHPWVQEFYLVLGLGVWRKAPEAFPDSNTTLDTFQCCTASKGVVGVKVFVEACGL